MRYQLGNHVIDEDTRRVVADGHDVEVEPRTFDVILHLLHHRDRVVTKEELLDTVWGDRFVTESALTTRIKHARQALGDDGRSQHVIRTIHRVGYQFVAAVTSGDGATGDRGPTDATTPTRRVPAPTRQRFGHDEARQALAAQLGDHRMVTVLGPGGAGKSTLCADVLVAERATDPVWWCDLTAADDAGDVPSVVLRGTRGDHQADAGAAESVVRSLERRTGTVVLDNCEHVIDAVAALAVGLIRRCPGVTVLATSRAALGVEGEVLLRVPPLAPDAAVACFCARAADAGVRVAPDDPAVAELCARLDHLPLALELAAARTVVLEPRQMLDLLDDRFRLLADRQPTVDARHASLDAVVDWSWDAATPEDQALLSHLSAFVGPFGLDDVVAVHADTTDVVTVVEQLDRLIATSLISAVSPAEGARRFRLLESVKDFARGRAPDPAGARRRHGERFAELATALDEQMQTSTIDEALAAMGAVWDDLGAAVRRAHADHRPELGRRIVAAVSGYADLFQRFEVLDWCELVDDDRALASGEPDAAAVRALRARLLAHRGHYERARPLAAAAQQAHESHATVLSTIWCAYYAGDLDLVVEGARRLLTLSRSARGMDHAFAEGFDAVVAVVRQEPTPLVHRPSPDHADSGVLGAFDCMAAGFRLCPTDPAAASELLEATVAASLRHDYRLLLGAAGSTLTQVAVPVRPLDEALRTVRRTLAAYRDRGMWTLILADVVMAARLLTDAGEPVAAGRLLGARAASGYHVGLSEGHRVALTAELREEHGEHLDGWMADGARLNPVAAADVAIGAIDRQAAAFT